MKQCLADMISHSESEKPCYHDVSLVIIQLGAAFLFGHNKTTWHSSFNQNIAPDNLLERQFMLFDRRVNLNDAQALKASAGDRECFVA